MIDEFIYKNHKKLRYGYTTGTCVAAAAKAAARMLLTGRLVSSVCIDTPKGISVTLPVSEPSFTSTEARCCVQKDAGDDADCTDKIRIYATVHCLRGRTQTHRAEFCIVRRQTTRCNSLWIVVFWRQR